MTDAVLSHVDDAALFMLPLRDVVADTPVASAVFTAMRRYERRERAPYFMFHARLQRGDASAYFADSR